MLRCAGWLRIGLRRGVSVGPTRLEIARLIASFLPRIRTFCLLTYLASSRILGHFYIIRSCFLKVLALVSRVLDSLHCSFRGHFRTLREFGLVAPDPLCIIVLVG